MSRRRNILLKNGNRIPRAGLLAYFRESSGAWVDTVGLSISDYANVDPLIRGIFFVDENHLVATETAVAAAISSPLLNTSTMIGSADRGVALYTTGTDQNTLYKALRYFHLIEPFYEAYGLFYTYSNEPIWVMI